MIDDKGSVHSKLQKRDILEIHAQLMTLLSYTVYSDALFSQGRIDVPVKKHKRVYDVEFELYPDGSSFEVKQWTLLH